MTRGKDELFVKPLMTRTSNSVPGKFWGCNRDMKITKDARPHMRKMLLMIFILVKVMEHLLEGCELKAMVQSFHEKYRPINYVHINGIIFRPKKKVDQ